ncbi:MAG: Nif3-like dinuclear metal center hexameric protein [Phycisphaerae bacterium]
MKVAQCIDVLETIAPTRYAEDWDNVGLLVGHPEQPVTRVMLCIDYTDAVAAEACDAECDGVIAYHPPIFEPIKRLPGTDRIYDAVRRGVMLYSPHTALDVAPGGTNDVLADALWLTTRWPLKPAMLPATFDKLAVFCPTDAVEKVAAALADAGAGQLGEYSHCTFRSAGTGTFMGSDASNPAVGERGRLERVDEIRLETIVPKDRTAAVVAALYAAHPYEEPAWDLLQVADRPAAFGMGRVGEFEGPVPRDVIFARIKHELGIDDLLVAGPRDGMIARAAVCAGSCGKLLDDAIRQDVGLYLTGEMRHHDALRAAAAGVTVVCTLHSNSERAALARLKEKLAEALPGLECLLSRTDRDPFRVV